MWVTIPQLPSVCQVAVVIPNDNLHFAQISRLNSPRCCVFLFTPQPQPFRPPRLALDGHGRSLSLPLRISQQVPWKTTLDVLMYRPLRCRCTIPIFAQPCRSTHQVEQFFRQEKSKVEAQRRTNKRHKEAERRSRDYKLIDNIGGRLKISKWTLKAFLFTRSTGCSSWERGCLPSFMMG